MTFVRPAGGGGGERSPGRFRAAPAGATLLGLSRAASDGLAWAALALLAVPLSAAWFRTAASRPVRALLRGPAVGGPHLALVAFATTVGAVLFVTPFYLLTTRELAASTTGLTVLALPLAMVVTAPLAGVLADRWSARGTAVTGMAILVLGAVVTAPLAATWTPLDVAWRLGVIGAGGGLFNPANLTLAMSHAPADLRATVGATTNLARQLGFAVGPAMATAIWALTGYTSNGMRAAFVVGAVVSVVGVVAAFTATTAPLPGAFLRPGTEEPAVNRRIPAHAVSAASSPRSTGSGSGRGA